MSARQGVLLVNLGTPDAPQAAEVRRYLREFLSDPRVLDIGDAARWALLNLIILPTRPKKSAEAYAKVWTEEGSPLLVHSEALAAGVAQQLPDTPVVLAMRYGTPSLEDGMAKLREAGCDELLVMPLYPQYAASSTGSTIDRVYALASQQWKPPFITMVPPFYNDARFIEAFAAVGRPVLEDFDADHLLMSFHGLPERHMIKSDPTGGKVCLASKDCCASIRDDNRNCYRAQSYATAKGIAAALQLPDEEYTVGFQSRLGRTPWIQPYTDEILVDLAKRGVKRLAVMCPAFVADCLETLEEIAMRAKEDFVAAGGEDLQLVPSLNAHPSWVATVVGLLHDAGLRDRDATPRYQADATAEA